VGDRPLPPAFSGIFIAADDLGREMILDKLLVQILQVSEIVDLFVPQTCVADVEAVVALGGLNEIRHIGSHLRRVERWLRARLGIDPGRRTPGENLQNDVRIALVRLCHQPPLITAFGIVVRGRAHMAGFGAIGGVNVSAYFDLETLQSRTIARLEQVVENLAALWLRIIDKKPRRSSRTCRAEPIENPSTRVAVQDNLRLLCDGKSTQGSETQNGGEKSFHRRRVALLKSHGF